MAGHVRRTEHTRNYPNGGWEARWRVVVRGRKAWRGKTFARKADAERFLAAVVTDIARGEHIDTKTAATPFREMADAWFATAGHRLKPKTLDGYDATLRNHVLPYWADVKVGDIDFDAIQGWVNDLSRTRSPSGVRSIYKVLRLVLGYAVKSGKIRANPCGPGIELPRAVMREMLFLNVDEVEALADAIVYRPPRNKHDSGVGPRPEFGLVVRMAAYTGLRAGELAALKVKHLDLRGGTLTVAESVSEVQGKLYTSTPKTRAGRRTVPLPDFIVRALRAHLGDRLLHPDAFVFTSEQGLQFRHTNFRSRFWRDAVVRALPPEKHRLRFHDLRHTYASLLVEQGAHPKEMAELLGHASAQITLDRYSHIMPGAKAALAARLDTARRDALGGQKVVGLDQPHLDN